MYSLDLLDLDLDCWRMRGQMVVPCSRIQLLRESWIVRDCWTTTASL